LNEHDCSEGTDARKKDGSLFFFFFFAPQRTRKTKINKEKEK